MIAQDQVAESCNTYFERYRRQTHVTPKSYLSFVCEYMEIYSARRKEIAVLDQRMKTGLKKLAEATESVNELSKELEVMLVELEVANKKAEEVLSEVVVQSNAAHKVKAQVQVVKDKAQVLVDAINADKANAEAKLEAARPALELAEAALGTIQPVHIATGNVVPQYWSWREVIETNMLILYLTAVSKVSNLRSHLKWASFNQSGGHNGWDDNFDPAGRVISNFTSGALAWTTRPLDWFGLETQQTLAFSRLIQLKNIKFVSPTLYIIVSRIHTYIWDEKMTQVSFNTIMQLCQKC